MNRYSKPCQLKKGGFWSSIAAPTSAEACEPLERCPRACSLGKNFKVFACKGLFTRSVAKCRGSWVEVMGRGSWVVGVGVGVGKCRG